MTCGPSIVRSLARRQAERVFRPKCKRMPQNAGPGWREPELEYDLTLSPDLHTHNRHTQWFYFRVEKTTKGVIARFNLGNFEKTVRCRYHSARVYPGRRLRLFLCCLSVCPSALALAVSVSLSLSLCVSLCLCPPAVSARACPVRPIWRLRCPALSVL